MPGSSERISAARSNRCIIDSSGLSRSRIGAGSLYIEGVMVREAGVGEAPVVGGAAMVPFLGRSFVIVAIRVLIMSSFLVRAVVEKIAAERHGFICSRP